MCSCYINNMDIMIDIECLGIDPDATILTIAAQQFNPFGYGCVGERSLYKRLTIESQPGRSIDDGTIKWWSQQPAEAREEALGEGAWRVDIKDALQDLSKLIFHADRLWANGPAYDMTILENAYKQFAMTLPWRFYRVRDCRTVYSLWPDLPQPPTTHHALEDCARQISMLQDTLRHLNIRKLK